MQTPLNRSRRVGRPTVEAIAMRQPPSRLLLDPTGRRRCPSCGESGVRRDGSPYKDGSAPMWCPSCGMRGVELGGFITITAKP